MQTSFCVCIFCRIQLSFKLLFHTWLASRWWHFLAAPKEIDIAQKFEGNKQITFFFVFSDEMLKEKNLLRKKQHQIREYW